MIVEKFLLIILFIYVIYLHSKINKNKNIEKFALSIDDKNEVRTLIKEIYNTDMDAVRTLAKMADDIQKGGLKVNGNLIVSGTITSTGDIFSASYSLSGLNTSIGTTDKALTTTTKDLTTINKDLTTKITELEKITGNFSGYEFKPVCIKQTAHSFRRAAWDYDTACDKNANINEGWNLGGFTTILPVKSKYQ